MRSAGASSTLPTITSSALPGTVRNSSLSTAPKREMLQDLLHLISELSERSPAPVLPARLDELFRGLAFAPGVEAAAMEDQIWALWMYHPHRRAAEALERATGDIAAQRYDIAETRLALLLRSRPDFPEAWNKRATL